MRVSDVVRRHDAVQEAADAEIGRCGSAERTLASVHCSKWRCQPCDMTQDIWPFCSTRANATGRQCIADRLVRLYDLITTDVRRRPSRIRWKAGHQYITGFIVPERELLASTDNSLYMCILMTHLLFCSSPGTRGSDAVISQRIATMSLQRRRLTVLLKIEAMWPQTGDVLDGRLVAIDYNALTPLNW